MVNAPKLVLTGGGTAGHVMPHLAVVPLLKKNNWTFFYIGSKAIEKKIISAHGIQYYEIQAGKLRRYFSWANLLDVFRVLMGTIQSLLILARKRPDLVFSKGGYVSVPVCVAAWILRIPVITHESDMTPGLANRIIGKFAWRILYAFSETARYLPRDKAIYVGLPIRDELYQGNKETGLKLCHFSSQSPKPVILFMGGSSGAKLLNEVLSEAMAQIVNSFRVIHITGKDKQIGFNHSDYASFEFVSDELRHLFAASDFVVSRAGANSIFEFVSLRKPMLLIPLDQGSRGDQILNASCFEARGWAHVLNEKDLNVVSLIAAIRRLVENLEQIKEAQSLYNGRNAASELFEVLRKEISNLKTP